VVDGGGDDNGGFFDVVLDNAFISVEVGVPGVGALFDRVYCRPDTRQAVKIEY